MLFTLRETRYDFETDIDSEERMKQHFESLGYSVLHNAFAAIHRPVTTKFPDADEVLRRRFGADRLNWVGEFYRAVYAGDAGDGVMPGQPDLFVYQEGGPEMFFCEVKKGSDVLSLGQMAGISIIHTMLGCRVQVARLNRAPRLYRWTWPNIQALHSNREITIGTDSA